MTGVLVLLGALVVAGLLALWHATAAGRFRSRGRGPAGDGARPVDVDALGVELGERATLLQFSSAFCTPCRATRALLGEVARITPGVAHVEVDAEAHLELVRELNILRTPTVLVLDAEGVERRRASGVPTKDQVLGALAAAI